MMYKFKAEGFQECAYAYDDNAKLYLRLNHHKVINLIPESELEMILRLYALKMDFDRKVKK